MCGAKSGADVDGGCALLAAWALHAECARSGGDVDGGVALLAARALRGEPAVGPLDAGAHILIRSRQHVQVQAEVLRRSTPTACLGTTQAHARVPGMHVLVGGRQHVQVQAEVLRRSSTPTACSGTTQAHALDAGAHVLIGSRQHVQVQVEVLRGSSPIACLGTTQAHARGPGARVLVGGRQHGQVQAEVLRRSHPQDDALPACRSITAGKPTSVWQQQGAPPEARLSWWHGHGGVWTTRYVQQLHHAPELLLAAWMLLRSPTCLPSQMARRLWS